MGDQSHDKMAAWLSRNLLVAFWACFCTFVYCEDSLFVTHSPSYVEFRKDAGPIDVKEVPNVLSLALGFSSSEELIWNGLTVGDLFRRPKANILFTIETIDNSFSPNTGSDFLEYRLHGNADVNLRVLQDKISSVYGDRSLHLELITGIQGLQVSSGYQDKFMDLPDTLNSMLPHLQGEDSIMGKIKLGSLNGTGSADIALLSELQLLREIVKKLGENSEWVSDSVPDIYSFHFAGLRLVQSKFGSASSQAVDAARLLASGVSQFSTEIVNLYGGDALVEVLTSHQEPIVNRQSRSLFQDVAATSEPTPKPEERPKIGNKAPPYDDDYPVVFNIILWMTLFLALAVYVISYGLWNLDPGDTIIYRMTSQRMKID